MNTHACLLCSFTSSSVMDLRNHQQQKHVYLYNMRANLGPAMTTLPEGCDAESGSPLKAKRAHDDIIASLYPAMKKRKGDDGSMESIVIKTKLSGGSNFTFEVSEDEEEECASRDKMLDPDDNESSPDGSIYSCKHCDFTHKSSRGVATHYQRMHPYIRFTFPYITDPDDKTATYRCLDCPIEFATIDDLKKHYGDDHPQVPDVFILRSDELPLMCKCFICTYTTTSSRSLRIHFKQDHPKEKVDNPLLLYSYIARNLQVNNIQSQTYTGTSSRPRSVAVISPEKAQTPRNEMSNTLPNASPISKRVEVSPISKRVDGEMRHVKSVAVTLDHHPEPGEIIEKIKLASIFTSSTSKSDKLYMAQHKTDSKHSKSQEVKSKNAEKRFICHVCKRSLSTVVGMITHQRRAHGCKNITALKIIAYSAKVRGATVDAKKSPPLAMVPPQESPPSRHLVTVSTQETPSSPHSAMAFTKETASSSSEDHRMVDNLFFCQVCNYGHPTMKGMLTHQRTRYTHININSDEILKYTKMIRGQTQTLPLPILRGTTRRLLFCQYCNFFAKGIKHLLNHQYRKHHEKPRNVERIREYTARVYTKSKKPQLINPEATNGLNPEATNGSSSGIGVINENLYFCPCCDYRNPTVRGTMNHQKKKHPEILKVSAKEIIRHTAVARSQKDKKIQKISANKPSSTDSPIESKKSDVLRSLRCRKCPYTSPNLYTLRRHLIKNHGKSIPTKVLIRSAYKAGELEQGYHCQWCVYSHSEAESVFRHSQESNHPTSLEYITSNLYAGPKRPKTKKQEHCSGSNVEHKHGDTLLSRRDAKMPDLSQKKVRRYPCRVCPFKSRSWSGIKSHYKNVHPWCVRDDGSVLCPISKKQTSADMQLLKGDVHNTISGSFNREEQLVDGSGRSTESNSSHDTSQRSRTMFKCPVCSEMYNTYHGLKTHCGKKHPEYKYDSNASALYEFEINEEDTQSPYSVYKCKHCPYVNTNKHGILAHIQMRHPSFKARGENLETKMVTFSNERTCTTSRSGKISRLRGFLCKLCPVAHANLSLLKDHYKSDHNRDASNKLKSIKHANVLKKQLLLKYRNTQGSVSQVGGLKKRHRCHRCNFVSAKMKALADHIHMSHKSTAEYTYMCSLCSYTSVVPVYLANHTRRAHGQAAYDKYYKPLRQRILEKQMTSMEHPNADRKECPLCPYLSYSESDMIAHYISTHRKNRQSSKPQAHLDKKKNICKLFEASSKKGQFQCKKCTMLYFDTPLLLSIHYTEFHRSDFRQDFAIPSGALKKFKEVFQCGYCSIKIQGKQELCSHLNNHAAAFWKKMKPVFAEPQPTAKTVKARNKELPPSCKTAETMVPEMRFDNAVDLSCDQCGRAFMSLKGLRSHERSHAQLAALKRQGPLANHRLKEEHFSHRPGTTKPFHCRLCRYRTNLMILLKRHLEKSHQEEYPDKHLAISATSTEDMDDNFENEDPLEDENDDPTQKRRYLEPPDVQQQLNRYKRNVLNKNLASAPLSAAMPYEDGLYRCEFCNFTSEHLSSVRRHYLHRHNGKKLLRCKDCSFFTCFRKKYEMHIEAGGSSCLTEAPRDLKCPLCLYHTRNRNNMIDHIDLHREERVVPIEVRRPKLSHYLEGIVFRCHKCTYTSGCEENLRLHMSKHDDIKPYKCRLCYFDCIQLSELEAHLCDKHQVMRNHELVGQVNLVQLETRLGQANGEKKGNTNMEPAIKEEEEKKLYVLEKQGQESKDIKVEKDYKQNMSQQNTGEQTEDGMANLDEMNKNNAVNQKSGEPVMEKEIQAEQAEKTLKNHSETHERQGQERPERTGSDNGYHEEMDMSRLNWDIIPCEIQHPEEERRFNPDARNHNVEKQFPEEPRYGNSSDSRVGQGHGSANEDGEGRNEKYERHWEENMGSLEGTEEVSAQSARSNEAGVDQYGEMPVLENVYHSEGAGSSLNEEEGEQEKKTEKTCNKIQEEKKVHEQQDGADENPESEREETTGSDVASSPQDACTSVEENTLIGNEKPLACKLCGRTLTNTIELQRHVMRHGL